MPTPGWGAKPQPYLLWRVPLSLIRPEGLVTTLGRCVDKVHLSREAGGLSSEQSQYWA